MFFSGPWHMGLVDEAGGKGFEKKWDIAKMPAKESGTSWVGGGELVVFKQSKNRETAWKFVEYLTQPEVQAKFYEESADLPSNQEAWELPQLADDPKLKLFGEQLEDAKTAPPFPKWEKFATELNAKLDNAFTSDTDPAEAAKEFQAAAEATGTQ
jgi:multiple sugar transport system substrate-binding protein